MSSSPDMWVSPTWKESDKCLAPAICMYIHQTFLFTGKEGWGKKAVDDLDVRKAVSSCAPSLEVYKSFSKFKRGVVRFWI